MCIGRAIDENVQASEHQVPKCPTFRLERVNFKEKTSQIPIGKDEYVPDSDQQG